MPIEFATSLERDLVYARWSGRIGTGDVHDVITRLVTDPHYRAGRAELVDMSAVSDLDIGFNFLRGILRRVNDQFGPHRPATHTVIWAPDPMIFGVCRMYQELAEIAQKTKVDVCREEAEVMDALGLPHAGIEDLLAQEVFLDATAPTPAEPQG